MQWENEQYGRLSDCVKVTFMLKEVPFYSEWKELVKDLELQKKILLLAVTFLLCSGIGTVCAQSLKIIITASKKYIIPPAISYYKNIFL